MKIRSDKDSSIPSNIEFDWKTTFAKIHKIFTSIKSDSNETPKSCGYFIQTNFKTLSDNAENYTFTCLIKLKLNGKLLT